MPNVYKLPSTMDEAEDFVEEVLAGASNEVESTTMLRKLTVHDNQYIVTIAKIWLDK